MHGHKEIDSNIKWSRLELQSKAFEMTVDSIIQKSQTQDLSEVMLPLVDK